MILERHEQGDSFFVIPVAAGGLDYNSAAGIGSQLLGTLGIAAFKNWNIRTVNHDPIQYSDAVDMARRVLERRLKTIHSKLPAGEPLRLGFYTRVPAPSGQNIPLSIGWSHCFTGRAASSQDWNDCLIPALKTIVSTLHTKLHGRSVIAHGNCTISAALALGAAFLAPLGIQLSWVQKKQGEPEQVWNLNQPRTPSGFAAKIQAESVGAQDLAVLVSVVNDVRPLSRPAGGICLTSAPW